jgi:hypothetical protein
MHWLIINTEAFSGLEIKEADKEERPLTLDFLPFVLKLFLSVFRYPYIILDESSKIKTNTPLTEMKKSSRSRLIKLLNVIGERSIMTGTLKSKSPLNVIDQYAFLDPTIITENMYEFAERYCIMVTIRVGRGRRVQISQKDYAKIRKRMINAWNRGGDKALDSAKASLFKEFTINDYNLDWIIAHKDYSPFIRQDELDQRLAPYTMTVKRSDVFDISFEHFVTHPIVRYVEPTSKQKSLTKELIDLGFTANLTLGKTPALELMHRLQDVCNGFEPISSVGEDGKRVISYKDLAESPKLEGLMELIEEIGPEENQIAVFSARTNFTEAIKKALEENDIAYAHYSGTNKSEAEALFASKQARIFLSNLEPSAYGLNCLSACSYIIYACVDYKTEIFYQSQHRVLRGQLTAQKFAYHLCTKGSVEERTVKSLEVGVELINYSNDRSTFEM